MARRDNTFLFVAAALAAAAWWLFKPARNVGSATNQNGQVGGGVSGSPNQVISSSAAQEIYQAMKSGWGV